MTNTVEGMPEAFGGGTIAPGNSKPFAVGVGEGAAYWFDRSLWIVLTSPERTGSMHAAFDVTVSPGAGAAAHAHTKQDEAFFVLEGRATFAIEADGTNRTIEAGPGDLVHVPRGVVHSFAVPDNAPVRFLNYYAPCGFEPFIENVGTSAERRGLPPDDLPEPDPNRMKEWAKRTGLEMDPGTVG